MIYSTLPYGLFSITVSFLVFFIMRYIQQRKRIKFLEKDLKYYQFRLHEVINRDGYSKESFERNFPHLAIKKKDKTLT